MRKNWYARLPLNSTYGTIPTPVGPLSLFVSAAGLHRILWGNEHELEESQQALQSFKKDERHPLFLKTVRALQEYFAGERRTFDVPLVLQGTDFQMQAWQALSTIPYGETRSYAEQAEKVGNRNKARAVGMANHYNPIPILIPCHRVIGANGQLTGFAGGIALKQYLLTLEKKFSALRSAA
ncbi:MAG: methylated-DNA--protein-cysteine methyltransferase [Gammaproteobacteria bacterium]|jgi:methylated-DNA-[protein]-cysteine S-methyltransferase|nr:methylated-DNA--protein-cysteine methyltransferase [Gammaproteobacteria bacterium]